jgi:hypothetical protein
MNNVLAQRFTFLGATFVSKPKRSQTKNRRQVFREVGTAEIQALQAGKKSGRWFTHGVNDELLLIFRNGNVPLDITGNGNVVLRCESVAHAITLIELGMSTADEGLFDDLFAATNKKPNRKE